jgi:hypothetical protein
MNKNDFKMGMAKLTAYYDKFEFPFQPTNPMEQQKFTIWYEALTLIDNFSYVVDYYYKTEDFPPQSPRSLLKVYEEVAKHVKGYKSADQAWELVRDRLSRFGLSGYYNSFGNYKNDFYDSIDDENIIKACKDIESRLKDLNTDNSSYVAHEFKQIYNMYVERATKEDILKIGSDDKLKLKEK